MSSFRLAVLGALAIVAATFAGCGGTTPTSGTVTGAVYFSGQVTQTVVSSNPNVLAWKGKAFIAESPLRRTWVAVAPLGGTSQVGTYSFTLDPGRYVLTVGLSSPSGDHRDQTVTVHAGETVKKPLYFVFHPPPSPGLSNGLSSEGYVFGSLTPVSNSIWWAVLGRSDSLANSVVRTTDGGQHWSTLTVPVAAFGSIYFLNAEAAWLTASVNPDDTGPPAPLYRTTDGGETWQRVGSVSSGCQLDFVDALHGWCPVIGAASNSVAIQLYRTADGGSSWSLVSKTGMYDRGSTPNALPSGCDKTLTFTSPTQGWASSSCNGGTALLYATNDGGTDWHALPAMPLPAGTSAPNGELLGTPVVSGAHLAVPVTLGPGVAVIATSSNLGASWSTKLVPGQAVQQKPDLPAHWSIDLVDPTHWRLTDGTNLVVTNDGGESWQSSVPRVAMKDSTTWPLTLNFLTPLLGWAIPVSGGQLSWTSDGGRTWQPVQVRLGT